MTNNNDKLNKLQADLVSALRGLPSKWQLLGELSAKVQNPTDPAIAVDEALAEDYRQIASLTDAILQLSDDEFAKALVGKLGSLISAEIKFLRGAAGLLGTAPQLLHTVIGKVIWTLGGLTGAAQHKQLIQTVAEAEAYFSAA